MTSHSTKLPCCIWYGDAKHVHLPEGTTFKVTYAGKTKALLPLLNDDLGIQRSISNPSAAAFKKPQITARRMETSWSLGTYLEKLQLQEEKPTKEGTRKRLLMPNPESSKKSKHQSSSTVSITCEKSMSISDLRKQDLIYELDLSSECGCTPLPE